MAQNIFFPDVTVNKLAADLTVSNTSQQVLFIGQQTSGSATSGELITDIQNDNSWDTLFGANSMIAGGIRLFREINADTQVDAIPLDDNGSGVDASGSILFVGTATETIERVITVASQINFSFTLAIAVGDTADDIGTALESAITAVIATAPFTASNSAGDVTFTAVNAGNEANSFSIFIDGQIAGITTTITAFTGGATNPVLTNIFDVIGDKRYQTIIWPGSYSLTELQGLLDPRFNADGQILDGVGVLGKTDTFANLKAFLEALNDQSIWVENNELESTSTLEGGAMIEIDYIRASQFGAVRSKRLTSGANITSLTITNAANDQIGGPSIATLPYANTPFPNLPVIGTGLGFSQSEIEQLRTAGGFVFGNNITNTGVILGEVVSTYKTDVAGNPDISFKFGNFVDTISNVAEYFFNNLTSDFKSSRLTLGELRQGFSMESQKTIDTQIIKYFQDLTGPVFLLLQGGDQALTFFKNNFSSTLDLATGTYTFFAKVPILTQLRVIIGSIQLSFDIN